MKRTLLTLGALAAVTAAGAGGYYAGRHGRSLGSFISQPADAQTDPVVYFRDPDGKPLYSLGPRKVPDGRDYLPVRASEDTSFGKTTTPAKPQASGSRRILYYRNPMGLPDTSPVPKKDWMGMDYIAVYEGEEQEDGSTVKVSLDRIQRSGVRTEKVESRILVRPVRGVGTVMHDERRQTIVTLRSDGYIEDLFVNTTGQHVNAGEPLFRLYSPDIQRAQIDLWVAVRAVGSQTLGPSSIEGAIQRLRNLGVPTAASARFAKKVQIRARSIGLRPPPAR